MDWQRIDTTKVTEELVAAAADLETFRVVVAGYFEQFSNPPYKRRPNLGLRLSGDSCIIGVRPVWSKSKMQLDCEKVQVECISDDKLLTVKLERGELPRYTTVSLRYGDAAVERLLQVVRSFVKDPQRVFRCGQDFCGICGRHLTDETSRTRGIGPECLVKYNFIVRF